MTMFVQDKRCHNKRETVIKMMEMSPFRPSSCHNG